MRLQQEKRCFFNESNWDDFYVSDSFVCRFISPILIAMITVTLHTPLEDANKEQEEFALSAVLRMQEMVNNPEFLKRLEKLTYTDNYLYNCKKRFQATNEDLIRIINGGIELDCKARQPLPVDNTIDLYAKLKKKKRNVVGGVTPPSRIIETNKEFFENWRKKNNKISLAGHWFHEWLHTAGFRHKDMSPDFDDAIYKTGYLLVKVEQARQGMASGLALEAEEFESQDYLDAYNYPADYAEKFTD